MFSTTEKIMQTILDSLPQLVWLKRDDNVYLFANQAWCDVFGLTLEETIGKTDRDLWTKEEADKFIERDKMVRLSGNIIRFEEYTAKNDRKPQIFFSTIKIPLFDNDGKCIATVGIATDITKEKKLYTFIEESIGRLEQVVNGNGV